MGPGRGAIPRVGAVGPRKKEDALRDETGPPSGKGISPGGNPQSDKAFFRRGGKALAQARRQDASGHPYAAEGGGTSNPKPLYKKAFFARALPGPAQCGREWLA